MTTKIQGCFFALALCALFACGPGTGKVRVTLLTNLGAPMKSFPRLENTLFQRFTDIPSGASLCSQNQIYAGWKTAGADDSSIQTTPVSMKTAYGWSSGTTSSPITASDWINTYSLIDSPVTLDIPAGEDVEFGIVGAFYKPPSFSGGQVDGDKCEQVGGLLGTNDTFKSISLIGHSQANFNTSGALPLNVWFIDSQSYSVTVASPPDPSTSGTGLSLSTECESTDCTRDLVGIYLAQNTTGIQKFWVNYFFGGNGIPVVTHRLPIPDTAHQGYIIPSIFPYEVHVEWTPGGSVYSSQTYISSGYSDLTSFPRPSGYSGSLPQIKLQQYTEW